MDDDHVDISTIWFDFLNQSKFKSIILFQFEPNQSSNQIFGLKFNVLPNQRLYQIVFNRYLADTDISVSANWISAGASSM